MLVLARRRNESVVIFTPAGEVTVTVLEIRGGKVRLGFDAPPNVPIHRREVARELASVGRTEIRSRQTPHLKLFTRAA